MYHQKWSFIRGPEDSPCIFWKNLGTKEKIYCKLVNVRSVLQLNFWLFRGFWTNSQNSQFFRKILIFCNFLIEYFDAIFENLSCFVGSAPNPNYTFLFMINPIFPYISRKIWIFSEQIAFFWNILNNLFKVLLIFIFIFGKLP